MFERLKKVFSKESRERREEATPSQMSHGPMSEWAATQGWGFSFDGTGQGVSLQGKVGGRPWRIQLGPPSRNYIRGEELRGRAELGIDENVAVLVMNRRLKEALEKNAYQMVTDTLQTSVDTSLPEEMRWLAMFEEVGWDALPGEFWDRYAVLTDDRKNALAWVDPVLARSMLQWPEPAPSQDVPILLLLLNGKAYLRMEHDGAGGLQAVQHASGIFTSACESALGAFSRRA